MATVPRKRSESDFYHVFQRGVNHYDIFEDDDDREYFMNTLKRYARKINVEIHAWCLMSNHVHLLVRSELEALSAFMRMLGSVYVRHFNFKHRRIGPLFSGRFGSVCVETDAQIAAVVRYIHRNPVHHDKKALFGSYKWSSYGEYVNGAPEFCELDFVLGLLGSIDEMIRFHEADLPSDHERHLDLDTMGLMSDDEARERANAALRDFGLNVGIAALGTLSKQTRNRALAFVRVAIGCSLRQLQRLTAIAYNPIREAVSAHA